LNDWFDQSAKASLNKAFQDEAVRVHFISGRILCLTGLYSRGYWPFLTEYLPRILIAEKLSVAFDGIAISARARNNMENMLEGLGLSLSQVHFIEDDHLYFVDELLVPSITWANTLNNQEVFHWLRAHYQKNKKNALKPFRKIFWARAKNDPRRFSNVDEIIPWLLEKGFEIYEDVPRPVQEQARIFSEASIVIFPHGSGGTNLIFCQPKTQVIEIMNQMENPYTFNMYKNVCESCGLSYASVLTETTFQHFNSRYSKNDHARLHLADLIQKYEELNIH
jgi:capsular polysaccharide biosynthesis protein